MARRVATALPIGIGVGAGAAMVYRWTKTPLLVPFMNDPTTTARAHARHEQSLQLDQLLREAAPKIMAAERAAAVSCGALDVQCRKDRAAAEKDCSSLKAALREAASRVAYDGTATAAERDAYVAAHGCIAWTEAALDAVAARAPVVEVGAGTGQWVRALRARPSAIDIVAYDDGSELPTTPATTSTSKQSSSAASLVRLGVDGTTAASRHPDRALLLVAPPPGPAAARWLAAYKGDVVLYAGEGRGGVNADEEFFGALERCFRLLETTALKPFPGGCEKLWVCERKLSLPKAVVSPPARPPAGGG
jgi:hypothetical protein